MPFSGRRQGPFGGYFLASGGTGTFSARRAGWSDGSQRSSAPAPAPAPAPSPGEPITITNGYGQMMPIIIGRTKPPTSGQYIELIDHEDGTISANVLWARPMRQGTTWVIDNLYANEEEIYDREEGFLSTGLTMRTYPGGLDQMPDPLFLAHLGPGNTTGQRRKVTTVFERLDLRDWDGRPPTFTPILREATSTSNIKTNYASSSPSSKPAVDYDRKLLYAIDDGHVLGFDIATGVLVHKVPIVPLGRAYSGFQFGSGVFRYIRETGVLLANATEAASTRRNHLIALDPMSGHVVGETGAILYPSLTTTQAPTAIALLRVGGVFMVVGIVRSFEHRLWVARYDPSDHSVTKVSHSARHWNGHSLFDVTAGADLGSHAEAFVAADDQVYRLIIGDGGILDGDDEPLVQLSSGVRRLLYRESEGALIAWLSNARVQKVRIDDLGLLYDVPTPYTPTVPATASPAGWVDFAGQRVFGSVIFQSGGTYYQTNLGSGITTTHSVSVLSSELGILFDEAAGKVYHSGRSGAPYHIRLGVPSDADLTLRVMLESIWTFEEQFAAEDTRFIGDFSQPITGGAIASVTGRSDATRDLKGLYGFEFGEWGEPVVTFVASPADGSFAFDGVIDEDDLLIEASGENASRVQTNQADPATLPRRISFLQRDPALDFEEAPAPGEINNIPFELIPSDHHQIIRIWWSMDAGLLRNLSQQVVWRVNWAADSYTFSTRIKDLQFTPGDVVPIPVGGGMTTIGRITRHEWGADWTHRYQAEAFLAEIETDLAGFSGNQTERRRRTTEDARYIHLDIPLLHPSDDLGGEGLQQHSVITSRAGETFGGGLAHRSRDSAETGFTAFAKESDHPAVGVVVGGLPDTAEELNLDPAYILDTINSLQVRPVSGDPAEWGEFDGMDLPGSTMALLVGREGGAWEVLLPTDASFADGVWTFAPPIYRGLAGTDINTGAHSTGSGVLHAVIVRAGYITRSRYPLTDLGAAYWFKATGQGQRPRDVMATRHVISGSAETPYAPVWDELAAT